MSVKRSSRGRRERLSVDDCEQHIIEAICSGEIEPSQRLGEVSVARELGVGQAHVRAAFDRLAYAGILDRRHRSGTYVREISLREFIEMTQVRALLEGFACRLACGHATESDLAPLERLGRELDQRLAKLTPDQYRQIERMDLDFHQRIVELSRSSVLKRILDNQHLILKCLRRGFDLPLAFIGRNSNAPNHVALVSILRKGDPSEADRCMRRHLLECLRAELRLVGVIDLD